MTSQSGRGAPPPHEEPDDDKAPVREPHDNAPDPNAPGRDHAPVDEPGRDRDDSARDDRGGDDGAQDETRERERVELDDKDAAAVRDRAASKGRQYARDQNPSGESNDPSLTSGPTRERKI